MKFFFFLFIPAFFFSCTNVATRQNGNQVTSCCIKPGAIDQFAAFAGNHDFVKAHESPLPYKYAGEGKMITFSTPDGKTGDGFEIRSAKQSKDWLFIFHEWWGLNDHIKQEAEKYYSHLENVNVLVIDLFDGKASDNPDSAAAYMQRLSSGRAENIINGAIQYAGPAAQIGTVGWCFGGGWSLQAGILCRKQGVGVVMYYGWPESDIAKLKLLANDVLGFFGTEDQWITPAVVDSFRNNMKKAGRFCDIRMYAADHAFANPSNPHYNKELADQAFGISIAYLQHRFDFK